MTVAVSWSGYFNKLLKMFGIKLPDWLTSDPASYTGEGFSMNLPALLIVLFVINLNSKYFYFKLYFVGTVVKKKRITPKPKLLALVFVIYKPYYLKYLLKS